jgi:hypothetical protein
MPDLSLLHASPFHQLTVFVILGAVIDSFGLLPRQPVRSG